MKILRTILCIGMICFLVFSPKTLVEGAHKSFTDVRFVRKETAYHGSIALYHIVRQRPYCGSLTQWLKERAAAYEKKHKGTYIEIEGMDEAHFYERLDNGRKPDAYSFFSGTLYPDLLKSINDLLFPYREGLFQTDRCLPYCYSGYCRLIRNPDSAGNKTFFVNDILATRMQAGKDDASEENADVLYLDLRRAGDLMRYKDGFALAVIEPIDNFSDAVCWIGIDRDADDAKAAVIVDFILFLLEPESQQTLNALGLLSVRSDVKNQPPEPALKRVFRMYESVSTVDPFRWHAVYDVLSEDAALSRGGDPDAYERFTIRLRECCS